ncbi:hypothetical protein G6F24_013670 [Rhizopus arrhizus]|nr:hypothetical protein G6F24_013670 [Rhizopus arrhizus]
MAIFVLRVQHETAVAEVLRQHLQLAQQAGQLVGAEDADVLQALRVRGAGGDVVQEEFAIEDHVVAGEEGLDLGVDGDAGLLPKKFVDAQREVEVLHGLGGRALQQVVQGRDHDHPLAARGQGEATDLGAMTTGNAADPRRFIHHLDQRLARIGLLEALDDLLAGLHAVQPQVGGERDATEMRRDVRHELDGHAQLYRHLALVHVIGQRIRHQVVGQQLAVGLVRRRGTSTGVTGDTEALRRAGQQVQQRMHRQLHRGGIATRVADVFLAVVAVAGQLRQTVVPAVVEAPRTVRPGHWAGPGSPRPRPWRPPRQHPGSRTADRPGTPGDGPTGAARRARARTRRPVSGAGVRPPA